MPILRPLHHGHDVSHRLQDIRDAYLDHVRLLGLDGVGEPGAIPKETIRSAHRLQRVQRDAREREFIRREAETLLPFFPSGEDIDPANVLPALVPVETGSVEARLFRLASRLWSVPVSRGFGRRLRFLVRDQQNHKLIGLLALGSPVFNLAARDQWIGWTVRQRERNLVHVMDAYVLGAVEPYASLLGAKLIGSLVASDEIATQFAARYRESGGGCPGAVRPELALVTTTSALGRSSVYNRLNLRSKAGRPLVRFVPVGYTAGYGHFHVPEPLFEAMRSYLVDRGREFASSAEFESGPNRRLRIIREVLEAAGISRERIGHGIQRQVFCTPLLAQWREVLLGRVANPLERRPSVQALGRAAVRRWVLPRAERRPEFRRWTPADTLRLLLGPHDHGDLPP